MVELKCRELQAVRIEIAVNLCLSFPSLYNKVRSRNPMFISNKERVAADVLKELLRLEPCIRHILDFHYKRMEK